MPLSKETSSDEKKAIRSAALTTAKRRTKTLSGFLSGQVIVQILSLLAGVLLVRTLSRTEYAYFTIANTMQGTMSVLGDSGIGIGVMSIGGKVWNDNFRLGQLINAALHLRKWLAGAGVICVTPVMAWMLVKSGASPTYTFCLIAAVLVALNAQLTSGVLEIVPRLRSEIVRITTLDLVTAISRLVMLGAAYLVFVNAVVAIMTASFSLMIRSEIVRRWARSNVDTNAPIVEEDTSAIIQIIKQQAPNSIFYCFQGQIVIWLVSIFGKSHNIAEVGALGRLAIAFALFGTLMANVVAPRFARCTKENIVSFYCTTIAASLIFLAIFMLTIYSFPNQFLWILGDKYSHLKSELIWVSLSSAINALIGVIWSLNTSRAWIRYIWLNIPATIIAELAILYFIDVGSTKGVILFGLFANLPHLFLNFYMSYDGIKHQTKINS